MLGRRPGASVSADCDARVDGALRLARAAPSTPPTRRRRLVTVAYFLDTTQGSAEQSPISINPYPPKHPIPHPPVSVYTCAGFSPGDPPRRTGVEEPRNE